MKKILITLILVLVPFFVFATSTSFKNNETPSKPSVEVVFNLNSDENSNSFVGFTTTSPDWGENANPEAPTNGDVKFVLELNSQTNIGEGDGYIYWILRGNKNITISITATPQMTAENEADVVLGWSPKIESRSINGSTTSVIDQNAFNKVEGVKVLERTSPRGLDYGYAKIAVSTESVADKAPKNYIGTFTLTIAPNG